MPEPSLYLFDGFNLLHAGGFGSVRELTDVLASFVAVQGARGIVVFDGIGGDAVFGPLEVRYAPHADTLLERLAAEHRAKEHVRLISSDATVKATAGRQVSNLSSQTFLHDMEIPTQRAQRPSRVEDHLDDETRARLERLRRGQSS